MMRRAHRIVLLFALLVGGAGMNYVQAATHSGNCGANGNNVIWSLNTSTGVLTISGSGAMKDFVSSSGAPWYLDRMSITSVTIANGVTTIGNYAFYACVKLSSVAIPSSVTSIGNSGFTSCTKLTSVNIPNSVTNIGIYAFNHCSSLISVNIPNGVTSIGEFTFNGCSSLTSMTIPNSVASIGVSAFRDCSALTDVYASWTGDAVPTMPSNIHNFEASQIRLHIPCGQAGAYIAKEWNTKFTLSDVASGTCGDNVQWTFESCNGTLTIRGTGAMVHYWSYPDIPWWNYRGSIQRIVIEEGVTTIGNHAFVQCSNLTSVSLPNTLTAISYLAFGHCTGLPSLTIPSSVTSMADMFIHNTQSLTDVYVSWTGDDVPTMPADIHQFDASHKQLHIPCGQAGAYYAKGWNNRFSLPGVVSGTCGDNVQWTFESCNGTLTISGTGEMYNWMSLVARPWHSLCTSIQRVVIEEGVTTTGYHAFYGASNLTSVSLPSTLQTLQFMTFFGCGKLTTLTIPSSVTYVGNRSLEGCSALTDVYMSETGDAIPTMPAGIHTYDASRIRLHIPCGQAAAYAAKGWNTKFTIDGVVSGTCGDNVQWTFESCNGTLSIFGTGPMADYELAQAPWDAYKYSITSVSIAEGVTSIGTYAFYYCTSMTSISLPNSLTSIGNFAFYTCGDLASVIIPNNVTNIGEYAFYYCTSLTSITIPNGVTSIEDQTFYNCTALSSVSIPSSVTSIGYYAFNRCALTSVAIPNSVTSIDYYAFSECNSLTDIYVSWTNAIPVWYYITDNDPQSSITLHVPCSAMSLYKAAEGWKDYTIEGEGGPYTITVESDDPSMGTVDAVKIGE